jgi:hypothetical protein
MSVAQQFHPCPAVVNPIVHELNVPLPIVISIATVPLGALIDAPLPQDETVGAVAENAREERPSEAAVTDVAATVVAATGSGVELP